MVKQLELLELISFHLNIQHYSFVVLDSKNMEINKAKFKTAYLENIVLNVQQIKL